MAWNDIDSFLEKEEVLAVLRSKQLLECTEHYRESIHAKVKSFDWRRHHLGFDTADEYYTEVNTRYPGIFEDHPLLAKGIPANIVDVVKQNPGWEIAWRKSTGDNNRFILFVPDNGHGYEQWYNIAPKQSNGREPFVVANISFVRRFKRPGDEKSIDQFEFTSQEIEEMTQNPAVEKSFTPYLMERDGKGFSRTLHRVEVSQCIRCHASGIHDIFVKERHSTKYFRSAPLDPEEQIKKMNERLHSYGSVDWEHYYPQHKLGPSLELKKENFPTYQRNLIERAFATKNAALVKRKEREEAAKKKEAEENGEEYIAPRPHREINFDRFLRSGRCSNCHAAGDERGIVNYGTSTKHLKQKTLNAVMPMVSGDLAWPKYELYRIAKTYGGSWILDALRKGEGDLYADDMELKNCLE